MSRKRAAKRRRMSNYSSIEAEVPLLTDVVSEVSEEIDELIKAYEKTGKKLDLLYLIKLTASKYAVEYYQKAITDVYSVSLDQTKVANLYSESYSQIQMARNAIKGELI